MRKTIEPTLDNVLSLFSKRLGDFELGSRRSYRKAYSSLQVYLIANYPMDTRLEPAVVENWVIDNLIHGLTIKTVTFYLDKISGLYSGVAHKFIGGKESLFKDVKKKLKILPSCLFLSEKIRKCVAKMRNLSRLWREEGKKSALLDRFIDFLHGEGEEPTESLRYIWGCMALAAGIRPDVVKGVVRKLPRKLSILNFSETATIDDECRQKVMAAVERSLYGEDLQWFAMRLRPGVKYDDLIGRFGMLNGEVKMPELFYPCAEIAKKIGRKVIWEGKPVIRDVVFFKTRKSEIYPLFTKLYDLAWCYRRPGAPGNYAPIPDKAMENFKKAIGILSSDFELAPAGGFDFKPGDEVVVLTEKFIEERGRILKKPSIDEDGNKIFRVTLLDRNSHWDIGVDARLIRKP